MNEFWDYGCSTLLRSAVLFGIVQLVDYWARRQRFHWQRRDFFALVMLLMLMPGNWLALRPASSPTGHAPASTPKLLERSECRNWLEWQAGDFVRPVSAATPSIRVKFPATAGLIDWLPAVYLIVAILLIGRQVGQYRFWRRRLRQLPELNDAFVRRQFELACVKCDMEPAAVRLLDGGTHLPVPASFGWDGFHIILPRQAAQQFSAHELELLFLHELIHLKRRDHWWKLLAGLSSAMWWFNPFVRWAEYRLTAATELEVDRRVLATAAAGRDQAADYARMLLAFHTPSGNTPALSGLSFHGRELKKRIQDILMNKKRNRCWSYGVILLAILAVMTTVWLAPGITTIATHTEVRNQVPSFAKLACYLDVEKLLASEFYPELSHIGQNNGMIGRVQKMFSLLLYPKVWEEAGFQEILAFVKALDTPNFYGGFVIRCDMPWATLRQKIADCNPQAREISINGLTTLEITPQNPDGTTASNVFILWPLSDSGSFALVEKSLLKAYRDELAVGFTARKELAGQLDDVPPDAVFFLIMTNTMPGFDALYNINVCLRNKLEFSAHVADPLEHRQISKEIANDRTRLEQQLGTKLPHFKLYVKDSYDYLFHWAIDKKQLLSLAAIVTEKRPNNTPTTIN